MTTFQKTVRFYDTVLINTHDQRKLVDADFWPTALSKVSVTSLTERRATLLGVDYFGASVSPRQPALPHLQIQRIRDSSEQLNRANVANGDVEPLDFEDPNERVSEPTYLTPFGRHGRVAVMSPAVQGTRSETISRWLTLVLGLGLRGYSLELVPVVDPDVLQRIMAADGAVMLEVHVDAGAEIPDTGGGAVGDAFRNAKHQALEEARMVFRWSLDNAGGTPSVRDALRNGALWVAQHTFTSSAKVKLADVNEEGKLVRDEARSMFRDRITKKVTFEVAAGQRASDEAVLGAVGEAIREFTQGGSTIGLIDTGMIEAVHLDLDDSSET